MGKMKKMKRKKGMKAVKNTTMNVSVVGPNMPFVQAPFKKTKAV